MLAVDESLHAFSVGLCGGPRRKSLNRTVVECTRNAAHDEVVVDLLRQIAAAIVQALREMTRICTTCGLLRRAIVLRSAVPRRHDKSLIRRMRD
jgi:enamine deaminase RidA (YjgF/YER057c/UK114 family)